VCDSCSTPSASLFFLHHQVLPLVFHHRHRENKKKQKITRSDTLTNIICKSSYHRISKNTDHLVFVRFFLQRLFGVFFSL
jgi:hypothetical protein